MDKTPFLERHGPGLIFGVALALRVTYLLEFSKSPVFDIFLLDAEYYDRLARQILTGDWLAGREVFTMSPLYPYFLALLHGLTGQSVVAVKLIQHVIGAATCALICRIGIRLGGPALGIVSGLLAATYGIFIFAEGTFENEFLVIFLNVLALHFLLDENPRHALRRAGLAGLCLGLSIGVRPNAALLAVPALWWLLRNTRADRTSAARAAVFVCVMGLTVLPITIRNHHVSGEWVWTTSTGGQLVYIGTLPDGGGGYTVPPFVEARPDAEHGDFHRQAEKELGRPVAASEVSGYWIRRAGERIRSDPAAYLRLLGKKFLAFCNLDEAADNSDYTLGRGVSRVLSLPLIGIGLVFPLAVLGLIAAARPWRVWALPVSFGAVYLFSVLLFYQSYRFRLPAVPILILFSGAGILWLYRHLRNLAVGHLFLGGVILISAAVVSRIDLPQTRPAEDALNIAAGFADVLERRGRVDQAAAILQDAVRIAGPAESTAAAYLRLAMYYDQLGNFPAAAEAARKAAEGSPKDPRVYYILGVMEGKLGRLDDSLAALRAAVRLNPDFEDAKKILAEIEKRIP